MHGSWDWWHVTDTVADAACDTARPYRIVGCGQMLTRGGRRTARVMYRTIRSRGVPCSEARLAVATLLGAGGHGEWAKQTLASRERRAA
jgi:hypothetical protein